MRRVGGKGAAPGHARFFVDFEDAANQVLVFDLDDVFPCCANGRHRARVHRLHIVARELHQHCPPQGAAVRGTPTRTRGGQRAA